MWYWRVYLRLAGDAARMAGVPCADNHHVGNAEIRKMAKYRIFQSAMRHHYGMAYGCGDAYRRARHSGFRPKNDMALCQ